jgi:mannose-1-phosphate guanylyltransferase
MTDAMLLCAGLGTRLQPLSDECPKALMPVGDRPLILHLLDSVAARGFRVTVVNAHHKSERIVEVLNTYDEAIHVSLEGDLLGTAGGIAAAEPWLRSDVAVVCNGDILANVDASALVRSAEGAGVALLVAPRERGEGTVGMDGEGRLVRMRAEVFGSEAWGGDYIGICALSREARAGLPRRGCLVGDFCLPRLRRGGIVRAVVHHGSWRDIGTLEQYQEANLQWLSRDMNSSGPQSSYRGASSWTGEGVELRRTVLGEGAHVEGRGLVERCVLWPGAHATAPMTDTIVTGGGRVVRVPTALGGRSA